MKVYVLGTDYILALFSHNNEIMLIKNGATFTTLTNVFAFELLGLNHWIYFDNNGLHQSFDSVETLLDYSSIIAISSQAVLFENGTVGFIDPQFLRVTLDNTLENIQFIKSKSNSFIAASQNTVYHKGFHTPGSCEPVGDYCVMAFENRITAIDLGYQNLFYIGFDSGHLQRGASYSKISESSIASIKYLNSVTMVMDEDNKNYMFGVLSSVIVQLYLPPFLDNPLPIALDFENEKIVGTSGLDLVTLDHQGSVWLRNMQLERTQFLMNTGSEYDTFDAVKFTSEKFLVSGQNLFFGSSMAHIPLDSDDKVKSVDILRINTLLFTTEKGVMIYDLSTQDAILYDKTVQVQVVSIELFLIIIKVNKAYYCVGTSSLCYTTNESIFESYSHYTSTQDFVSIFGRMKYLLNARSVASSNDKYMFVTNDFKLFGFGYNMVNMFGNTSFASVPVPMNIGSLEDVPVCRVYGPFNFAYFVEACDGRIFKAGFMIDEALKIEDNTIVVKDYNIEEFTLFRGYKIHQTYQHLNILLIDLKELPPRIPNECYISNCTIEEDAVVDNGVVLTNSTVIIIKSNTTIVDSSVVISNPSTSVSPIVVDGGTIVLNNTELVYKIDTQDIYDAIKNGLVIPIISTVNNGSIQGDFSEIILDIDPSLESDCRSITATTKLE